MSPEINQLCVIALLDGRPGHEKQTMGIIRALQQRIPVRIIRLKVKSVPLIDYLVQTCRLFLPFSGVSHPQIDQGDLLIGTGSRTHLPMLLYKKKYAIPAITCMMPAIHLRNRFDVCFVPAHDRRSKSANIRRTAGAPNCSTNKRRHQADCGLILLGGVDAKSHHWDSRQVMEMVEKICTTDCQKIWTISSSPRTPQDMVSLVRQLMDKYTNIQFFDYRNTPPGWVEEQYDKSSVAWITADSISMVYEALTAGCSVGIIPVQWRRDNSKFKRNEDLLLEKKLVQSFASWEQGNTTLPPEIDLNEAQRCADWILQKWRQNIH